MLCFIDLLCTQYTVPGSLMAVGGSGGDAIYLYHHDSRSWVKVGDLPGEKLQCACAVLPSEDIFLAGGAHTETTVELLTLS